MPLADGPAVATDLDVGVLGPYLFDKFSQALRIERSPLFVADTYLMEVERSWVTHLGTQCTPLGTDGAVGELDEVEGIVDIRPQVVNGHVGVFIIVLVLILAGQPAVKDGRRVGANLL